MISHLTFNGIAKSEMTSAAGDAYLILYCSRLVVVVVVVVFIIIIRLLYTR